MDSSCKVLCIIFHGHGAGSGFRRTVHWDARLSKTLAYKIPVCEKCIAKEYDMDVNALRDRMEDFFGMRPCQGI